MLWCVMLCEWYWISIMKCTAKGWRLLWRMPLLQITTLLTSHLHIKPAVLIETGTQNAVSAGFATIADSTSGKKWGLTYVAGIMRIHKIEVKYHNLVGFPVSTLILLLHAIIQYPNPIKQELQWSVEFQAATDETHWTCRSEQLGCRSNQHQNCNYVNPTKSHMDHGTGFHTVAFLESHHFCVENMMLYTPK